MAYSIHPVMRSLLSLFAVCACLLSCTDSGKDAGDENASTTASSSPTDAAGSSSSDGASQPATAQAPSDSAGQNYTYSTDGELRIEGSDTQYDILLPTDFLFDFDEDKLRPEAAPLLDKLKAHFATHKTSQVHVVGHTDSKGDNAYNHKLSQRRAIAVQGWLKANTGVYAMALGRGEEEPVAANENPDGSDNPQGRQLNRRVVIRVVAYPDAAKMMNEAKSQAGSAEKTASDASATGAETRRMMDEAKAKADAAKARLK